MSFTVVGEVFEWRGPAPFHFVALSAAQAAEMSEMAREVTYGWGMIPVTGRVGRTSFATSLWPKEGTYYVPLKDAVRSAEGIELGDELVVELELRFDRR